MTSSPSQPRTLSTLLVGFVLLMSISVAPGSLSGCGPSEPVFDKATQYTPESLAQEFLFRYKGMNIKPKRAPAPSKRNKGKLTAQQEEKLATKSKEQTKTKKAGNATLEDLLEDIAKKAETVKNSTPSKVLREMAAIVSQDTFVPEVDKKILAERIEGFANSFE